MKRLIVEIKDTDDLLVQIISSKNRGSLSPGAVFRLNILIDRIWELCSENGYIDVHKNEFRLNAFRACNKRFLKQNIESFRDRNQCILYFAQVITSELQKLSPNKVVI